MFFHLPVRISIAAGSKSGAITTSAKPSMICVAMASVTALLAATTPPYAESGSHASAFACAAAMLAPTAIPHGLECLMIATQGCAKS